jgi:hypothetical protein
MLKSKRSRNLWQMFIPFFGVAFLFFIPLLLPAPAEDVEIRPEKAQFEVFMDGQEIGKESFTIEVTGDTITTRSTATFRNLGIRRQKVQMESELSMDRHYLPQTYQLRTDVGGQKGTIKGTFGDGEAIFEYRESDNPRKRGLLVGDTFVVLDTNVFHHFIFLVRLFDFAPNKRQSIEVVIPQALDGGILKVNEIGIEKVMVGGKQRDLRHLRADSGLLQIDLWIDDQRTLYKIAMPAKNIEVLRKS